MEPIESNPAYCRRRAAEERAAAHDATDERAAQAHRALALQFEALASEGALEAVPERSPQSAGTLPAEFRIIP